MYSRYCCGNTPLFTTLRIGAWYKPSLHESSGFIEQAIALSTRRPRTQLPYSQRTCGRWT